ncbi:hypothetical protein AAG570_008119 [Ranatra chinensis]|uniref:Cyclic nucleotide-binding domain-containing protein n=1 Tax=Ranatra chinensis TaxID=642074 RepID=A0ABD0XTW1_9HEMI
MVFGIRRNASSIMQMVSSRGTFGVFENRRGRNEFVANLTAGDCINESVLLHLPTKPSMAYARTDGIAWYVDRDTFSRLTIRKTYWDRFFKTKLIGNIPVLKYLQDDRKLLLAEAMEAKSFSDSQPIMTIGSIVEGLYFIVGGNVGVFNQTPRGTIHPQPTILHKGDYFGATSIDGRTEYARSAAYAIGQCNLMLLKSSSIYRIAGKD